MYLFALNTRHFGYGFAKAHQEQLASLFAMHANIMIFALQGEDRPLKPR